MRYKLQLQRYRHAAALLAVMALAIAMPLLRYSLEPVFQRDGTLYANMIQSQLDTGKSFYEGDFAKPPLFMLLAAGVCRAGGISPAAGMLTVNIFCHVCWVLAIGFITWRIFRSGETAFFCALCAALLPSAIDYVCGGLREISFLAFFTVSIAALVEYHQKKKNYLIALSGILAALAFLCRFEGVIMLIFAGYYCLVMLVTDHGSRRWKYFTAGVVFVVAFAATVAILSAVSPEVMNFIKTLPYFFKRNV